MKAITMGVSIALVLMLTMVVALADGVEYSIIDENNSWVLSTNYPDVDFTNTFVRYATIKNKYVEFHSVYTKDKSMILVAGNIIQPADNKLNFECPRVLNSRKHSPRPKMYSYEIKRMFNEVIEKLNEECKIHGCVFVIHKLYTKNSILYLSYDRVPPELRVDLINAVK